jgi:hypothetical protein
MTKTWLVTLRRVDTVAVKVDATKLGEAVARAKAIVAREAFDDNGDLVVFTDRKFWTVDEEVLSLTEEEE